MTPAERTSKPFQMTRRFDAPRELVFAALTQLRHLERWMSPKGFTPVGAALDLRVGGTYHYAMRAPDGNTMWGKWTFREITAPERLVVVVQFSDEHGGVTRHPMAATWPLATLSTTTLVEEGPNRTLMTLDWRALNADETEEATFDGAHAGMTQGWGGTMDVLADHLAAEQRAADEQTRVSLDIPTEIVTTRVFAAPRDLVWKAFTERGQVERWWGPMGFTTTTKEMDVREGGVWRSTMHGPDGRDYPNRVAYTRVEKPALLAWVHDDDGKGEIVFRVTVRFEDLGARTKVTFRHHFEDRATRDATIERANAVDGVMGTFERLARHLAGAQA